MEVKDIVESFRYNEGKFQEESVLEARKHKKEITEELLKELEKVANNIEEYAQDDRYFLHFYAMFLLAEFREKRAFPIILKLITQEQEDVDWLLGDFVTEDLKSVLASTFDGNIDCLYQIMTNLELDEYIRGAVFESLVILQEYDRITQEQMIELIEKMLDNELQEDDSILITDIIIYIEEEKLYDKISLVRKLYNSEQVSIGMIGEYDEFVNRIYGEMYKEKRDMIEDTVESLSWWACFEEESIDDWEDEQDEDRDIGKLINAIDKLMRVSQEIGRNDPCPCRKWEEI